MKPYLNLYCFLGTFIADIVIIVLFERWAKKGINQKRVKEHFLFLTLLALPYEVYTVVFHIYIKHGTVPLIHSLWIIGGLFYANIEFLIMKKRLHGNVIKNTFFIPSYIFVIIVSFLFPVIFLPFIDIFDYHILRGKILSFMVNFLFAYSSVLYWQFRRLERTIGIIYFEKKILGFLQSKNREKPH